MQAEFRGGECERALESTLALLGLVRTVISFPRSTGTVYLNAGERQSLLWPVTCETFPLNLSSGVYPAWSRLLPQTPLVRALSMTLCRGNDRPSAINNAIDIGGRRDGQVEWKCLACHGTSGGAAQRDHSADSEGSKVPRNNLQSTRPVRWRPLSGLMKMVSCY